MCLIAFALNAHPAAPLLIASNRDEFWRRPTSPLSEWPLPNDTRVYAGRDGQAGGTWLGFSASGRVAMLTNVRTGDTDDAPRSRGELVTAWLAGGPEAADPRALMRQHEPGAYGGFNLVVGDVQHGIWAWLSNRTNSAHEGPDQTQALPCPAGWQARSLGAGVYGLSNASLNTPWPKTVALQQALVRSLELIAPDHPPDSWQAPVLNVLWNATRAALDELPHTGIPRAREHALSSAFVHMPDVAYGTRSSLLARWDGQVLALDEWTHPSASLPPTLASLPPGVSDHKRISISMWGMPTSS